MSRFLLGGSSDVELLYDKLEEIGFIWERLVKLLPILGIDDIILVPSKTGAVNIPLNMSTSEKAVSRIFKPNRGDIVLDIGAYFGRYTMICSKAVGSSGKVISIEAHPKNFQILKKNVIQNKSQNVILLNIAVSNCEGWIKLYGASSGGWYSIINFKKGTSGYIEVPCKTVDKLLEELAIIRVDWVKIDVEGAEQMVIEGSQETLAHNKNLKVILEIHPRVADEKAIFSLLEQMHYTVRKLEPRNPISYHVLASR